MKLSFSYKAALLAAATPLLMAGAQAATVTISCGSVGQDFEFCKKHTEEWARKTGHQVKLFTIPNSTTDILALFRQMFAASRRPEPMPCPAKGGVWCAASPASSTRPLRHWWEMRL